MILVGGWTTPLKNMLVKLDHFRRDRCENTKYLKPPPRIAPSRELPYPTWGKGKNHRLKYAKHQGDTVDGQNPAPPGMV